MKIISVIGTRPQYIKHASLAMEVLKHLHVNLITIDTGQHYDTNMSKIFVEKFGIKDIKYNLGIGSGTHGEQTGKMLIEIEKILFIEKPNFVIVYGDTNSTLSGALAAVKLKIPVIHIEAGMRNHNIDVPEEVNRTLVDRMSSLRFAPSSEAIKNLSKEGLNTNTFLVGDVTTDLIKEIGNESVKPGEEKFYFATIHRPFNTDSKNRILQILNALNNLEYKVILAMHPRTKNVADNWNIVLDEFMNIQIIEPIDFFDSINHIITSEGVITDSGSLQKEAYILKKKCTTILKYTPWQETLMGSWNFLLFDDLSNLNEVMNREINFDQYIPNCYGDGKVAEKIMDCILHNA
ncbi:MAG: UDP-N-acetylglucosamine 2-epimerase (non-hydrolyzing) [Bacteroidetes bacterium]|nr:UDP-N-acetylglucosamine 2-epimerase (non-hydrolyzing) [Bacteroidota bacterium]